MPTPFHSLALCFAFSVLLAGCTAADPSGTSSAPAAEPPVPVPREPFRFHFEGTTGRFFCFTVPAQGCTGLLVGSQARFVANATFQPSTIDATLAWSGTGLDRLRLLAGSGDVCWEGVRDCWRFDGEPAAVEGTSPLHVSVPARQIVGTSILVAIDPGRQSLPAGTGYGSMLGQTFTIEGVAHP